jgi:hypothetical protein
VRRKNSGGRSNAIQFREWRVVLMRNRGQLLGWVNAPDPESPEIEAAKRLELNDWQRRRLLLRECLSIRNEPKARS